MSSVKKIVSYKTTDGTVFENEAVAKLHQLRTDMANFWHKYTDVDSVNLGRSDDYDRATLAALIEMGNMARKAYDLSNMIE